MSTCIFCDIVEGRIPAEKVYEDDQILAFKDINPVAPIHVLLIPKKHIPSALTVEKEDALVMGQIFTVIPQLAKQLGVSEKGFRIVNNCGTDGQQTVGHIHFHLLGGRQLTWPPG